MRYELCKTLILSMIIMAGISYGYVCVDKAIADTSVRPLRRCCQGSPVACTYTNCADYRCDGVTGSCVMEDYLVPGGNYVCTQYPPYGVLICSSGTKWETQGSGPTSTCVAFGNGPDVENLYANPWTWWGCGRFSCYSQW